MKSLKMAISYGVLIWFIPFVISVLIFFFHTTERPLFESIMAVTLVAVVVLFTSLYFKNRERDFREGLILGAVWFLISLSFDFLFFIGGPAKMTPGDYIKDIGLTYLIIPIITLGFTYKSQIKKEE
jgi:hypothetical protein